MTSITISRQAYTIDSHPNKELVFEWIRDNWHDLNDHDLDDMIDSLLAISKHCGFKIVYSISTVPDRSEKIKFIGDDVLIDLDKLIESCEQCEFSGTWHDYLFAMVINQATECLGTNEIKPSDLSHFAQVQYLNTIHDQTEYVYSDDGLEEFCHCNEYYFYENGEFCQ